MSHSLDELLGQGLLLALNREEAKQLFAAREPNELRQFLQARLPDIMPEACAAEIDARAVICDGLWPQIQHVFEQSGIVDESLRPALQQCLTGGRVLLDGADFKVWLVRPDMVRHVARALQSVNLDAANERLSIAASSTHGSPASSRRAAEAALQRITLFYRQAADEQAAVVFAAQPPG